MQEQPRDLFAGYDPGTRKIGVAFVDNDLNCVAMDNYDIHVHEDLEYTLATPHYYFAAQHFVKNYEALLKRCIAFGIETQPYFGETSVMYLMIYIECEIKRVHPEIKVVYVSGVAMRNFWGISVQRSEEEIKTLTREQRRSQNKTASWTACMTSEFDKERIKKFFVDVSTTRGKRRTVVCHDPWEAALYAVYLRFNYQNLAIKQYMTARPTTLSTINRLENIEMFAPAAKPPIERKRKAPAAEPKRQPAKKKPRNVLARLAQGELIDLT